MENRELVTLPLAPLYKARLYNAGYRTVSDINKAKVDKLCKDTGLNKDEFEKIISEIHTQRSCVPKFLSANLIKVQEESAMPIMTFSERLDIALGGGIYCGELTEICGVPGIGKTQLCLQLACDVQIPSVFGGLEGKAVYIDTEGGFIGQRVMDIVTATIQHCHYIARDETVEEIQKYVAAMTPDVLLSGIYRYCCYDNKELLATVSLLPELLKQDVKIKLIIIDSASFHFRHDFTTDMSLRTRILTNLSQNLLKMAKEFNVAVVVTNQMTTKVHQGSDNQVSHLVPCMGESWGHACTNRIILECYRETRWAWLYKSPSQKQIKVPYQITKDGIRDVVNALELSTDSDKNKKMNSPAQPQLKRQRTVEPDCH